jgi:hypothetical protein
MSEDEIPLPRPGQNSTIITSEDAEYEIPRPGCCTHHMICSTRAQIICKGCQVHSYCTSKHQIKSLKKGHGWVCTHIWRARCEVKKQFKRLQERTSGYTPEFIESKKGRWAEPLVLQVTVSYLQARCNLLRHLSLVLTTLALKATLREHMELYELDRLGFRGLRHRTPFFMLRLGMEQEC